MVRKTKFWAIMFSVVFVIGLAAFLWLRSSGKAEGAVARIWLDGELYEEIELDAVVMPYEFDVTTELGTNLNFNIEGRVPGFFNGCCHDGKGLSSASV